MDYTTQYDGTALSTLENMKSSKFLKSSYDDVLPCTTFTEVLKSVLAYARSLYDSYEVPFEEALIEDTIIHM